MADQPMCVSFATIMSGLVLRWYADEAAFRESRELANAGRECFQTFDGCPADVAKAADSAHSYLTVAYASRPFHPQLDVSRWVTHKAHFGSKELTPVARSSRGSEP